jgi:hypothetical protein
MLTTRRPMHRSAPSASNTKVPAEVDAIVLGPCAETGQPLSERGRLCRRAPLVAHLDALGVAGEEEELAQTSSTSVGRVLAMVGVMLLVVAAVAWWLWGRS